VSRFLLNFSSCSDDTCWVRVPSDSESALHAAHIPTVPLRNVAPQVAPSTKSDESRTKSVLPVFCPGYELVFPKGHNHFGSYPFGLHVTRTLPWSFMITNDTMVLYSDNCTNTPRYNSGSGDPLPCSWCRALHNHTIIMGICHQAMDGSHENTPWQYLSFVELIQLLKRKNHQLERLHFTGLNMGRVLAVRNRTISGYKRLAVAISVGDIKRIHSLFWAELRNGAGVFGLLDKTNKASQLVYSPKGYEEADYQRAFLIWKLGGRSAANIAYHTLGVPSIDTARRHISTTPLVTSAGMPTIDEINANLAIDFEHQEVYGDRIIGMTMPIDEIKLQERLRWDPRTNMILGVCREHGGECVLEFRTMEQANHLVTNLVSERVHMASEASCDPVFSISCSDYHGECRQL
jgi:hypothetical protein